MHASWVCVSRQLLDNQDSCYCYCWLATYCMCRWCDVMYWTKQLTGVGFHFSLYFWWIWYVLPVIIIQLFVVPVLNIAIIDFVLLIPILIVVVVVVAAAVGFHWVCLWNTFGYILFCFKRHLRVSFIRRMSDTIYFSQLKIQDWS